MASSLSLAVVAAPSAEAAPVTTCALDASTATLVIETAEDPAAGSNQLTLSRTPEGRFQVSWPGQDPTDCGGATVTTVDTVVARAQGTGSLTVAVDLSNGPFAPGKTDTFDAFRTEVSSGEPPSADGADLDPGRPPGLVGEDDHPEIEFDLHLPEGPSAFGLGPRPASVLQILGSEGDDHVVAGQTTCPSPEGPFCREYRVNLNAGADADADVHVTFGDANPPFRPEVSAGGNFLDELHVAARGGDDVVSAAGGSGTGAPLAVVKEERLVHKGGVTVLEGGPGDDVLIGGDGHDTLLGGEGNDRLEGRAGDDSLGRDGDVLPGGIAFVGGLFGGPGDDVLLGGDGVDLLRGEGGNDTLSGGKGSDAQFSGGVQGSGSDGGLFGGPGDDVLAGDEDGDTVDGGPGDDVLDEGPAMNASDTLLGGDGHDVVDYSKRTITVVAQPGDNDPDGPGGPLEPDGDPFDDGQVTLAGEFLEKDNVAFDVEDVRLAASAGTGDLRIVGEMPALVGCTPVFKRGGSEDKFGPCPLLVDPIRNLGFAAGVPVVERLNGFDEDDVDSKGELRIYDLETLSVISRKSESNDNNSERYTGQCKGEVRADDTDWVLPGGHLALQGLIDAPCGIISNGAIDTTRSLIWAPLLIGKGRTAARANCLLVQHDYTDPTHVASSAVAYDACPRRPPAPDAAVGHPGGEGYHSAGARPIVHLFLHEGRDELYVTGTWEEEAIGRRPTSAPDSLASPSPAEFTFENVGSPLIVRRLRAGVGPEGDGLGYAWDLDLRAAGCGRRVGWHPGEPDVRPFVARVGDDLLAYCWDTRPFWSSPFPVGEQGYLVRIPLDPETRQPLPALGSDEAPLDGAGAYVGYRYVRTPTLPGFLDARVDEGSGTVLLVTDGPVNGNAVYVFDPGTDRFVGVVTGGAARQPFGNTAVGVDGVRGRTYLLTQEGILVVPTGARPLPTGIVYPVAANPGGRAGFVNTRTLAVAPELRRIFVPVNFPDQRAGDRTSTVGARYLVLEDNLPDPVRPPPADPDANTAQVDEAPGVTETAASGAGAASGTHVVVTGGVTRTLNQADPACRLAAPSQFFLGSSTNPTLLYVNVVVEPERGGARIDQGETPGDAETLFDLHEQSGFRPFGNDGCAADQALTPGHREVFLGASEAEAGSGSVAEGSPLRYGQADVTDADIKRPGACGRDVVEAQARGGMSQDDVDAYRDGCDQLWDEATGQGATPAFGPADPRPGLPDPRAGTRGRDGAGFPVPATACGDFGGAPGDRGDDGSLWSSGASCDHQATRAAASARAPGLLVADRDQPLVTVAGSASSVTTHRDPIEGQVTVSAASAQGVVIGPLSIREVKSVAVTAAKGRTGTAVAQIERRWCGVTLNEEDVLGDAYQGALDASGPAHKDAVAEYDKAAAAYEEAKNESEEEAVKGAPKASAAPDPRGQVAGLLAQAGGCVDPDDPANEAFVATLNQALVGKVQVNVPPVNGDGDGAASPGGYQAVVFKDEEARGGDVTVNDDDTHTVSALEAVVYNDGSQGRNRVVVQLAGVHAEARYGIALLPQFAGFDGSFATGSFEGTPSSRRVIPGTRRAPSASTIIEGEGFEELFSTSPLPENPVRRFLGFLPEALKDLWRLFVQHPLEFLLLFFVFSLLATPAYLAYRRRTFVGVVAG